jgi:hypothetical protein
VMEIFFFILVVTGSLFADTFLWIQKKGE